MNFLLEILIQIQQLKNVVHQVIVQVVEFLVYVVHFFLQIV